MSVEQQTARLGPGEGSAESPSDRPSGRRSSSGWIRRLAHFAYVWLMVGFFTGTLTLLGPVRWVTAWGRGAGWSEGAESWIVIGVIAAYVGGSALLSWGLIRWQDRLAGRPVRFAIPGTVTLLAVGAMGLWMNPAIMGSAAAPVSREGAFTYGPYPDRQRLAELKRAGYSGVVSLLHPAVVPFEPKLLADELEAAREVGIEVIQVPMLPWVSSNDDALSRIRRLAEEGGGRYYVHCYLGRDRVNVARRVIEAATAGGGEVRPGASAAGRRLADALEEQGDDGFERGPVYRLEEGVYLTPYPTDEELFAFYLGTDARQVLSLLDPELPDDVPWIEEERRVFQRFGVSWALARVPAEPFEPQRALEAARAAKELPRPLLVHAFLNPSIPTQGFLQAYRTDLPPLPPKIIERPLERGPVRALAPNVAAGPRPGPREFGRLHVRGVRRVAYVGDPGSEGALADQESSSQAGLVWSAFGEDRTTLLEAVSEGGPWYVYGPGSEAAASLIAERLGPPVVTPEIPGRHVAGTDAARAGADGRSPSDR